MASDPVALFQAWLARTGTPDEVACFNRSIVEGFLAVAGGYPVEREDVSVSVQLARDAGIDVAPFEQLGALIVRFGTGEAPTPLPDFADLPTVGVSPEPEPEPEIPTPTRTAEAAPVAPISVSFRAPTPLPIPVRWRRRRTVIAAGVIGAIAISGVLVTQLRGADPRSGSGSGSENLQRVAALDLAAELPSGWLLAPNPRDAQPHTAMLYRGGTIPDPDQAAFLATLPLADELAAGVDIDDGELLHAARTAELGAATQVPDGERYVTRGCATVATAAHTAMCRGVIKRGKAQLALRTYLRVGATRAVVAVFMAKAPTTASAADDREPTAIVASLKP